MMSIRRQLVELLSEIGFIQANLKIRQIERLQDSNHDGVALALKQDPQRNLDLQIPMIKGCLLASLWPNGIHFQGIDIDYD
jgi:hypothetical protein